MSAHPGDIIDLISMQGYLAILLAASATLVAGVKQGVEFVDVGAHCGHGKNLIKSRMN